MCGHHPQVTQDSELAGISQLGELFQVSRKRIRTKCVSLFFLYDIYSIRLLSWKQGFISGINSGTPWGDKMYQEAKSIILRDISTVSGFDMNVLWSIQKTLAQLGPLWPYGDLVLKKVLLTFNPTIHLQITSILDLSTCPQSHRALKPTRFTRWPFTEFLPHYVGQVLPKAGCLLVPLAGSFPLRGKCLLDMSLQAFQG